MLSPWLEYTALAFSSFDSEPFAYSIVMKLRRTGLKVFDAQLRNPGYYIDLGYANSVLHAD